MRNPAGDDPMSARIVLAQDDPALCIVLNVAMKGRTPAPPSYVGYRFPTEIISYAVAVFPLSTQPAPCQFSLRHVDEILAAHGILVSHETIRQWGLKFGQTFANQIRNQ
jgi:putative transposase